MINVCTQEVAPWLVGLVLLMFAVTVHALMRARYAQDKAARWEAAYHEAMAPPPGALGRTFTPTPGKDRTP